MVSPYLRTWGIYLVLVQLTPAIAAQPQRDSTRWQADIDQFLVADQEHPTAQGGVVFVGSSSIRMWDLGQSFPGQGYLNRGFGGSEIGDSTHYFAELVGKHQPGVVVFYAGDNDLAAGNSAEQALADFRSFVRKFKLELSDSRLLLIAIKPSIARWNLADTLRQANALIAADCATDDKLTFVDVWPVMLGADGQPRADIFLEDGLHMNAAGYKLWVELITPLLKE